MKQIYFRVVFSLVAVCGIVARPAYCAAQVVGDTAVSHIATGDTATQKTTQASAVQTDEQPQTASADTVADSAVLAKAKPFQPNPKKAGLYSALVPGLGQLYNRQYWKVPVVYAGLGVAVYFIADNYKNYESYYTAYIGRINNPYPTDKYVNIYSTSQLQQLQNDYSKYLDLTALCSVIGYAMQVLDAVTGAHLKNFDISRDISMKVQPVAMPNGVGLGLVMNIK